MLGNPGCPPKRRQRNHKTVQALMWHVADPAFCKSVVEATIREFGKLDVLVNNAAFQSMLIASKS